MHTKSLAVGLLLALVTAQVHISSQAPKDYRTVP